MQSEFGREQSQLSRIEAEIKTFMITNYRHCVVGNLLWYEDRFPECADAYNRKIAYSPFNLVSGTVPPELFNIIGGVDGCSFPVARLTVSISFTNISHSVF